MEMLSALEDYRRARQQAELETLVGRLTNKSVDLLCYEDVRDKLGATQSSRKELREIELDRIVGSVGRCTDFTRRFLPRGEIDGRRWARTEMRMSSLEGLPPIEVYELGGVYFVQDGHHRVSVARHSGATHLEAYVKEVPSHVSLPLDADAEDVIVQGEYNEFLAKTRLDELRPGAEIAASVAGHYSRLLEHIDVHRYFMGLDEERPIPYTEAVAHWYDHVYLPVVDAIRSLGILQEFPGRTEADLYLWVAEHRYELSEELGWDVNTTVAVEDLAERFGGKGKPLLARIGAALGRVVAQRELEGRSRASDWHAKRLLSGREEQLFADVLVAIDGRASGWRALKQASLLSKMEAARIHGLHVLPPGADGEDPSAVRDAFGESLEQMGLIGELTVRSGAVPQEIADLARWTDLVIVGMDIPPERGPMAKLGSGIRTIINRSPRPMLFVPGDPSPLSKVVLAYDGSPKAEEALFVATYVAGKWNVDLTLMTALEPGASQTATLERGRRYLAEHGVEATVVAAKGEPAQAIMETVDATGADWIIMGGYGFGPVLELVLGSTVDQVLRESPVPVLICR